jgi:hypothetical protein
MRSESGRGFDGQAGATVDSGEVILRFWGFVMAIGVSSQYASFPARQVCDAEKFNLTSRADSSLGFQEGIRRGFGASPTAGGRRGDLPDQGGLPSLGPSRIS